MSILVEILYSEKCPLVNQAFEQVDAICKKNGLDADIQRILIDGWDKAIEYSFIGSPSVRVNGLDVDPRVRRGAQPGLD